MNYYKLQLLHQENTYNKVFNAKPTVGILNPLELKVRLSW